MAVHKLPARAVRSYGQLIRAPAAAHTQSRQPRLSVSGTEFRQALSQLAAGTSIVTTYDQDGQRLGLTATAVTALSLDPPLVLVCVDQRARTAAALSAHAPFIIHFLAAGQAALAIRFASPIADKFTGVSYTLTASGCARIDGVLASVECVTYQVIAGGDHLIVIGRVVETQIGGEDELPLVYFRSQFMHYNKEQDHD
jgi:flavin reductase (DIM6/NTAB) family NADH-FMN oxidoreductase RutF